MPGMKEESVSSFDQDQASASQNPNVSDEQAWDHILDVLLEKHKDTSHLIKQWMTSIGVESPKDLFDIYFASSIEILDHGKFKDKHGNTIEILKGILVSIRNLVLFECGWVTSGYDVMSNQDWLDTTVDQYKQWCRDYKNEILQQAASAAAPGQSHSTGHGKIVGSTEAKELAMLTKNTKIDLSMYPTLKDDKNLESFYRHLEAVMESQGLDDLLDDDFVPNQRNQDAVKLFQYKNRRLYPILMQILLSDETKTFVREHHKDKDSQAILLKIRNLMKNSVAAQEEISKIVTAITTIRLDSSWRGSTTSFLLHFKEQLRKLDHLQEKQDRLSDSTRRTFLENAVKGVPDLRNVKTLEQYQRTLEVRKSVDFSSYFEILKDAASLLDASNNDQGSKQRRSVYTHDAESFHSPHDDPDIREGTTYGGIDMPVEKFYEINRAQSHSETDTFLIHELRRGNGNRTYGRNGPPREGTRDTKQSEFVSLPRELWNQISAEFREQISTYNRVLKAAGPKKPEDNKESTRSLNHHQSESDQGDQREDGNPLLTMATGQSDMSQADIRNVLSIMKSKRSQPVTVPQEEPYMPQLTMGMHNTYSFSKINTSSTSQLVDRGANGGLVGSDMKVLNRTGRKVNIVGIDSHELTGLDIVTCAAMYMTNKGKVIGVFHEYAFLGKGRSIHSSAQLEWFKNKVDDKSVKVGGLQKIETLDGYTLPLEICSGLAYAKPLGIPTDEEMDSLPHVIMTSPHEWDPSIVDYTHPDKDGEQDWETLEDTRTYHETRFDLTGDYKKRVIASLEVLLDDETESGMPELMTRRHHPSDDDSTISSDGDHDSVETVMATNKSEVIPTTYVEPVWKDGIKKKILFNINDHEVTTQEPIWHDLRPYFGYTTEDTIKRTFKCTTRFASELHNTTLRKHFKSRNPALNIPRRNEPVATDSVFSDTPAVDSGAKAAQVFIGRKTLIADVHPLKRDSQFINTLEDNIRKRGAMNQLVSDRAQVEISKKVQDILRGYAIGDYQAEPQHQHQNFAENRYGTIKRWVNAIMNRTGAAANTWLLCMLYVCVILNHLASPSLGWITPKQAITGVTPDISHLLIYKFNKPIYFSTTDSCYPSESDERSGKWVGFGESVGDAMTWKILTDDTKKVLYRSSIRSALKEEDENKRLSNKESKDNPTTTYLKSRHDKEFEGTPRFLPGFDPDDLIGRTYLQPANDDGERLRARVKAKIVEIEEINERQVDNIKYLLDIGRGKAEELIAYNELVDYLRDDIAEEMDPDNTFKFRGITAHQGPLLPTDKGYKGSRYNVQIEWETGEVTHEPLAIIAKDDPITCAVYAKQNDLLNEPGWKFLRRHVKTEQRQSRAIKQSKLRQARRSVKYQYGIAIPRDYKEALDFDQVNGNTKWYDSTELELGQISEYQTFKDKGKASYDNSGKLTNVSEGFKKIRVHLIFAVKHDGRHKARLVADGHLTKEPVESVYSGVVSLRSLRMVIFLAELNKLELWGADIGNAYLESETKEKVYIIAGPEFGELEGHVLIIFKALYGLRTSGARWHDKLHDVLKKMGFTPSKADEDVWMRPVKDGSAYEYIAVYVDDLCIVAKNCKEICKELEDKYNFKLKGDGPLTYHLGCGYVRDKDGTLIATPKKYIDKMISTYEQMFSEKVKHFKTPLEPGDHPEDDMSELCDDDQTNHYATMIGQLQWLIALGRFDIFVHTMTMSRFRAAPKIGHLQRLQRIYGYVHRYQNFAIRFRTGEPDYSSLPDVNYDWDRSVYGNVTEEIPEDIPTPRGQYVTITTYKDANLLHDNQTGRSVTAILHLLNGTPSDWHSKRQATVETATFGSEFVAAKTAVEQIIDLRNSLRYLGVPVRNTTYMFGDNQSVQKNASVPTSLLNKRHLMLAYHRVREVIAAGFVAFHWINGKDNPADILSKHWDFPSAWPFLKTLLSWHGETSKDHQDDDNPKVVTKDKGE